MKSTTLGILKCQIWYIDTKPANWIYKALKWLTTWTNENVKSLGQVPSSRHTKYDFNPTWVEDDFAQAKYASESGNTVD